MADTNCNARIFRYAPIALKVHEALLANGPVMRNEVGGLIQKAADELQMEATDFATLLPIMEFGGLINVRRRACDSHKTGMYLFDDYIVGVPQDAPAEVKDDGTFSVGGFTPIDDEEAAELIAGLFDEVFGGGPATMQTLHAEVTFDPAEVEEIFVLHGLATGHAQDRSVGFVNLHDDGSTVGVAINREGALKVTLDGPAS